MNRIPRPARQEILRRLRVGRVRARGNFVARGREGFVDGDVDGCEFGLRVERALASLRAERTKRAASLRAFPSLYNPSRGPCGKVIGMNTYIRHPHKTQQIQRSINNRDIEIDPHGASFLLRGLGSDLRRFEREIGDGAGGHGCDSFSCQNEGKQRS